MFSIFLTHIKCLIVDFFTFVVLFYLVVRLLFFSILSFISSILYYFERFFRRVYIFSKIQFTPLLYYHTILQLVLNLFLRLNSLKVIWHHKLLMKAIHLWSTILQRKWLQLWKALKENLFEIYWSLCLEYGGKKQWTSYHNGKMN